MTVSVEKYREGQKDLQCRIMSLQKRLTTLVTNIQTAADAKEMERRSGMEDNCRIRYERLKDDAKACQEKVEEIRKGWSIVNQKVVHSELQSVLDSQQQLCAAVIEDKKKLIRELQWERRVKEDEYLKNLRRLDEEIKLMLDRMQQQFQNLSKAYREELTQLQVEPDLIMMVSFLSVNNNNNNNDNNIKNNNLIFFFFSVQLQPFLASCRYTTAADARKFEEMWVMMEEEVTQLAEKALAIDSLICKHLGLAWECPSAAFMESPGPRRSQDQRMMDASVGPSLERDSEHGTGVEEGELSSEMLMKAMELLCDEMGFLVEDKLRKLLAPMEKNEQTTVKLHSLFAVLGLEEKDLAKLAEFLLMYKRQQGEQTVAEAMENSATADSTSRLINPNNILPALRCFLEQHRKSVHERSSLSHPARDTSVEEAYWDRLGNIITEDKLKLWDAAERELKQYEEVLMDISELVPETELLRQQNTKLRMQLQQILSSTCTYV
uniref:Dynein regulatory complex protein 1 n=1 Tax=Astatotilapia calliptera TaxID=8154 RepID=A0A3P8QN61_ASTCA